MSGGLPGGRLASAGLARPWARSARWALLAGLLLLALLPHVGSLERDGSQRPAAVASTPTPAAPVDTRRWVLDPPVGARTRPAFTLLLYIDESDSTTQSDATGNRHAQALLLRDWLNAWGRPDDRLALVRFADRPAGWGPVPVRSAPAELPVEAVGGGTRFAPVFDDVLRRIALDPSPTRYAVLLTDGVGDDPKSGIEQLPSDTRVLVLGLDDNGAWSRSKPNWDAAGIDDSWRLRDLSQAELAGPIAELLTRVSGQTVRASPVDLPVTPPVGVSGR